MNSIPNLIGMRSSLVSPPRHTAKRKTNRNMQSALGIPNQLACLQDVPITAAHRLSAHVTLWQRLGTAITLAMLAGERQMKV
jgi:hypothetical protein